MDPAPPHGTAVVASVPALAGHVYDWTVTGATLTGGQGTSAVTLATGAVGGAIGLFVTDAIAGCRSGGSRTVPIEFLDVPAAHPFHGAIAAMDQRGLSTGCGGGNFCPDAPVTRSQMAVFVMRLVEGAAYKPPAPEGSVFADVPLGTFLGDWIEELADRGFTTGCGGGNFCPDEPLNRAAAAVFLLRAEHGAGHHPPPATGAVFDDVPLGTFLGNWIEELAAEGITAGCAPGKFCPDKVVTRGEMAAFVSRGFPVE